jgi:hypothetical protein
MQIDVQTFHINLDILNMPTYVMNLNSLWSAMSQVFAHDPAQPHFHFRKNKNKKTFYSHILLEGVVQWKTWL